VNLAHGENRMPQPERFEVLVLGSGAGGKLIAWHLAHGFGCGWRRCGPRRKRAAPSTDRRAVELHRADPFRLPKIVFGSLHGFPPDRKAALVGPLACRIVISFAAVDGPLPRYTNRAEATAPFSPAERCPAYNVPQDVAAAIRDRQRRDNTQTAELISRGTPTVPVTTGIDGGMNPIFLAAVKSRGGPGATIRTASGTIPAYVNPPAEPAQTATGGLASAE
jgi:hypothetical protein